jgi:hypothetical protein
MFRTISSIKSHQLRFTTQMMPLKRTGRSSAPRTSLSCQHVIEHDPRLICQLE